MVKCDVSFHGAKRMRNGDENDDQEEDGDADDLNSLNHIEDDEEEEEAEGEGEDRFIYGLFTPEHQVFPRRWQKRFKRGKGRSMYKPCKKCTNKIQT